MKAFVLSLGCPKNLTDSEVLMGKLSAAGYVITFNIDDADIIVVNTCAFLKTARAESIDIIRTIAAAGKTVLVAGCLPKYAQNIANNEEWGKMPNVRSIESIDLYDRSAPRIPATPAGTAYIKIAEGCDNHCSYCLIPKIRGRHRVRGIPDILSEVRQRVKNGVKEVIYVAQETTNFPNFAALLKKTARINGIHWVRIMYANPKTMADEIIEAIRSEPKIVKYVDMPIQHISDKILASMNRAEPSKEKIIELIARLRQEVPQIVIRTSVIVGFPGETKEDFEQLLDLVREMRLEKLVVFEYSREAGTPAARMKKQVSARIKRQRFNRVRALQRAINKKMNQTLIGQVLEVLYEGEGFGRASCDSPRDGRRVKIMAKKRRLPNPGEFVKLKVVKYEAPDLVGLRL